eukprot:scaffold3867_cov254-Pinguiococcus_pyrenoidosus.AAC.1
MAKQTAVKNTPSVTRQGLAAAAVDDLGFRRHPELCVPLLLVVHLDAPLVAAVEGRAAVVVEQEILQVEGGDARQSVRRQGGIERPKVVRDELVVLLHILSGVGVEDANAKEHREHFSVAVYKALVEGHRLLADTVEVVVQGLLDGLPRLLLAAQKADLVHVDVSGDPATLVGKALAGVEPSAPVLLRPSAVLRPLNVLHRHKRRGERQRQEMANEQQQQKRCGSRRLRHGDLALRRSGQPRSAGRPGWTSHIRPRGQVEPFASGEAEAEGQAGPHGS